jgi:hypothetical protein
MCIAKHKGREKWRGWKKDIGSKLLIVINKDQMLFHQNKEGANMEKGQFDSKSIASVYKLLEDILNTFKTK